MYFAGMYRIVLISQGVPQLGGFKYTHTAVARLPGVS